MGKVFPKKYDRDEIERKWRGYWAKEKTYEFRFDPTRDTFSVDTPPPYVNADSLHAGHIMSYSQAEFIVRFMRMQGKNVFYPMGFDDNGLPTERYVEKKYNVDKSKISKKDFIDLCLKETKIGEEKYKDLWTRLGISVDWSKTYSTISPLAVKTTQWSLIDLYKKNLMYRKESPVLWCPSCETALAQADLEDTEFDSTLNYISFSLKDSNKKLTVATSRPELLAACVALYVNPTDSRYKNLIDKSAIVPIFGHEVKIIGHSDVDKKYGTGLMMVCTWGDAEDVKKWLRDKLATRAVLTRDGKLNELAGPYEGMGTEEARGKILDDLGKKGFLVKQDPIKHVVNVHERCGTPVEFVLSKQWFIKIVDNKKKWLTFGKKIQWFPKSRFNDFKLWVNSLKWDWIISRQRFYGVPFPIWYCQDCGEPIFADEKDLPVDPTTDKPPVKSCPKCKGNKFVPEEDVVETWATSSNTPFMIRDLVDDKRAKKILYPPTVRPNAFEIIRTWDFYSVVKSAYHFNSIPFEKVMISGHGLDEHGRKISKRLGNYMPSDELLSTYGADAIRYWATGATLGQNLRFNPEEVRKGERLAIKLWNVARFASPHIEKITGKEKVKLEPADIWIINETNKTIKEATEAFEGFTYAKARDSVEKLFWSTLADYYVEMVKYRLYGEDEDSKRAAAWTLYQVYKRIVLMFAPIMPFVAEEIYQTLFDLPAGGSVHLAQWPTLIKESGDAKDFDEVIKAIDEIRKYKNENGISLGAEIEEYKLKTKVNLGKYGDLLQNTLRVKKISG